jgi:hypothetical protein
VLVARQVQDVLCSQHVLRVAHAASAGQPAPQRRRLLILLRRRTEALRLHCVHPSLLHKRRQRCRNDNDVG